MNREEGGLAVVNRSTTGRSTQVMGKGVSSIAQGGEIQGSMPALGQAKSFIYKYSRCEEVF